MTYAVDFVINVMKDLSSSEPVLFERSGSLYVVSDAGFGQVAYGLYPFGKEPDSWHMKNNPERYLGFKHSQDALTRSKDDKIRFKKEEQKYFESIKLGPDEDTFKLEDIVAAASKLRRLPDDGKIRMVAQGSSYHSHKHGYACDGIDVYVTGAKVMDRQKYLALMRKKEEILLHQIESRDPELVRRAGCISDSFYACVIVTPHMMVTLPVRYESLRMREGNVNHWSKYTHFSSELRGGEDIYSFTESPFKVQVALNSNILFAEHAAELRDLSSKNIDEQGRQVDIVSGHMRHLDSVMRLNKFHNAIFAKNISDHKKAMAKRRK